ncbi:MAG: ABC transporter permease [Chloroflexia bacterium]|nr:ABC transporter permease [Chloroflexia bacterium]
MRKAKRTNILGFYRDSRLLLATAVVVVIVIAAIGAPVLAPRSPEAMNAGNRLEGPSASFVLGTDSFGRDLLSRIIHGARLSLTVSVGSVLIGTVVGTILGLLAGYFGRTTEMVLMRLVDLLLAFPSILSALFVVAFVGTDVSTLIVTIGILFVPEFARIVHGAVLATKQLDYVEAARTVGNSDPRIMVRAILPNILAPIAVQVSLAMGGAILLESSLSFLGLGPPPPTSSWGRMVADAASFMRLSPFVLIWPAAVIAIVVLAFNILGDVIRDRLDPRLR